MNEPITVVPRVIGAIIAVVLQIALAPNIALFGVVPNFIMAYVLIVSIVCPDQSGPVFAFVLGLLFDLLGTGPVGLWHSCSPACRFSRSASSCW